MFTIYGNRPPTYDPKAGEERQNQRVAPVIEAEQVGEQGPAERRHRPDRRLEMRDWTLPERRKRNRRGPQLLSARTGQPERLGRTKGVLIDTSV